MVLGYCFSTLRTIHCLSEVNLARPAAESRHDGLYVLLLLLIYLFLFNFSDSRQTNYLKIYCTDLRQIFRVGRTMTVDGQTEMSFSIPQGMLPWQPIFVGFIHRTESSAWMSLAQLGGLTWALPCI